MNDNKRFWDIVSPLYNRFMRNNKETYDRVAEVLATHICPDMRVLEIGCGTGEFTQLLAPKVTEWVATDFSEPMVRKAAAKNTFANTIYKVEDATSLTFADNSFDAVMIANTLHVMPNPATALREIHRVLKLNGLLLAPTFVFDSTTTKMRVKLLELIGFKVYNKWNTESLCEFTEKHNFTVIHQSIISAKPLSEFVMIATSNPCLLGIDEK